MNHSKISPQEEEGEAARSSWSSPKNDENWKWNIKPQVLIGPIVDMESDTVVTNAQRETNDRDSVCSCAKYCKDYWHFTSQDEAALNIGWTRSQYLHRPERPVYVGDTVIAREPLHRKMDLFSRRRSRFVEVFRDRARVRIPGKSYDGARTGDASSRQMALGSSSASTCGQNGSAIDVEERDEWDVQEILQVLQARGLDAYWSGPTKEIVLNSTGIIRPPYTLDDCTVLPSFREEGFDIATAHSWVRHTLHKAHRDIESRRRISSLKTDNPTRQKDTTMAATSLPDLSSGPRDPPLLNTSMNGQTVEQPRIRASLSEPSIPALAGPSRNMSDIRFPLQPYEVPLGSFQTDDEVQLWEIFESGSDEGC
ncbi:MAG: hypothetical protein Q9157_005344 [Trypethelium eluteriae]